MKQPLFISLNDLSVEYLELAGGKAVTLAGLKENGVNIASGLVVTTAAYTRFVQQEGVMGTINLELNRKAFEDMRWEEIWDLSLRIRNLFLRTPLPPQLREVLIEELSTWVGDRAFVVRSSSPAEDGAKTSFAGLHESYVNVKGMSSLLEHIKLVWASLWSDRALLYRQELGLSTDSASMAVLIQELMRGNTSGIVFSKNPMDGSQTVIEAVHGLNQGLVDGSVQPDRWFVERETGKILIHQKAQRERYCVSTSTDGVELKALPEELCEVTPLTDDKVSAVFALAQKLETLFQGPQDIEWTYKNNQLVCLQARPITTVEQDDEDKRPWYISLHRTMSNLEELRQKIENELLPGMEKEASLLAEKELTHLDNASLIEEINTRKQIHKSWRDKYWDDCIPFAHGMRLFGQVYNDTVKPQDPHEFMELLTGTTMLTTERNELLAEIAQHIREKADEDLIEQLLQNFSKRFAKTSDFKLAKNENFFRELAERMAAKSPGQKSPNHAERKEKLVANFLDKLDKEQKEAGQELLEIGRTSYRLRDEDNLYLGQIIFEVERAIEEAKKRLHSLCTVNLEAINHKDILRLLQNPEAKVQEDTSKSAKGSTNDILPRQLLGQPAGPGVATGTARILTGVDDLHLVEDGEILVCDAISPTMSFVVPLVAAIVERRGGMLIHGAIIAREYGIPCVTGVPDAAKVIKNGDRLVVDGYLGIIRVERPMR